MRFKRIVFGLTCSLFLLNATVKLHLEKFLSIDSFKIFIEKLLLNLYVDDLNNSFDNIKDAIEFYKVSKKCLADGNFILHKWATNCEELRDFVNTQSHPSDIQNGEDQTYVITEFGASEKYRKVPGINWDTNTNPFVTEFDSLVEGTYYEIVTNRNALKFSASLFDPLGLASPFILPSNVLFQSFLFQIMQR